MKAPSLLFSFLLSCVLLLPYLCKLLYTEPFPAIILPSGHGKMLLAAKQVEQYNYECKGYKGNEIIDISFDQLLPSIPIHYRLYVAVGNHLGFSDQLTQADKASLQQHYQTNIGMALDSIQIHSFLVKRSLTDGAILSKELVDKQSYKLK